VEGRTYEERIIFCFVVVDEINELTVASAGDFARRIWHGILGLAETLVGIERLLKALALLARACFARR